MKKENVKSQHKKTSINSVIPTRILRQTVDVPLKYITRSINKYPKKCIFPGKLKELKVIYYKKTSL